MKSYLTSKLLAVGALAFLLAVGSSVPASADTNATPATVTNAAASAVAVTNSAPDEYPGVPDSLRSYLIVQDQLRNTQLAIERSRQEADAAATRNAERLTLLEKTLASQRLDELKEMQHSNRLILISAGVFALIAFLVLLLTAFLQWTAVNRLAAVAATLPATPALGAGHIPAALGMGDGALAGAAEESTKRLLGTIERLEKRILEMEGSFKPQRALPETSSTNGHGHGHAEANPEDAAPDNAGIPASLPPASNEGGSVGVLLGKGDTLLKLDQSEGALACFEQALTIDPGNAEAMVRKGLALERLQRLDEAIACYDNAIASDSSMTMAYLYKGGVFNRMERFGEALECYEKALKAQEKTPGAKLVAE